MANERSPSVPPTQPERRDATIEEWLAIPHEKGTQLIRGRLVYEAMPDPLHGRSAGGLFAQLDGPFDRAKGDRDRPGGWWLSLEVDLKLGTDGVRPDLCGWRREKHPPMPEARPKGFVTEAPDWVCEVLSPSTTSVDLEDKRVLYHRAGVAHYWLLDFERRSLTVLRHSSEG